MPKRVFLLSGFIIATLFFSVVAVSLPANAKSPDFIPGETQVIVAFGKIPGQDLYAHVWVVIPHGSDKNQIVNESLRHQGLKPFSHSEFSTTGMVHDQFIDGRDNPTFVQNYNPANDPTGGFGHSILQDTQSTWTLVPSSNFAFTDSQITDRCPSLVKECPGRQTTDGNNDVAWMSIKNKNTLGVTWYSTSANEADMALNTNFSWSIDDPNSGAFDVETVYLHENGHVLGLGHSEVQGSIMEPIYDGIRQSLHQDDICGIQTIYGTPVLDSCEIIESPTATYATVDYKSKGGRMGVTVTLLDDRDNLNPVPNTDVKIYLSGDNGSSYTGTKTTDDSGNAKWNFVGVPAGTYTTVVLEADGVSWASEQTESNTHTK